MPVRSRNNLLKRPFNIWVLQSYFQVIYALRNLDRHFQIIVKLIGYFRKFCPLIFFVNNIFVTNSSLLCVSSYFSLTSVTVIMISNELLNCIRAFHIDELHSVTTSFFKLKTPCKMLNALNSHSTKGEKLFVCFVFFLHFLFKETGEL